MNKYYKIEKVFPSDKSGFMCMILTQVTQSDAQYLKPFCSGKMNIKTFTEILEVEKTIASLLNQFVPEQTFFAHIKDHDYISILITDDIMENDIRNRIIIDLEGNYI